MQHRTVKSNTELANMLDDTNWGHHFDRSEVEHIASYMSLVSYIDGEKIFSEGDRERYMAFIVKGAIDIYKESRDGTEKIVVTLSRRSHFGEMAFIDEQSRSASAYAKNSVSLLLLTRENFEALIEAQPKIGIKMLKLIARMISDRLRSTTGKWVFLRE